jgi:hypothetical protein
MKITQELINLLLNDDNIQISNNSKCCELNGKIILVSKSITVILKNNMICENCNQKSKHIAMSDNDVVINENSYYQIIFLTDNGKLINNDGRVLCEKCYKQFRKIKKKKIKQNKEIIAVSQPQKNNKQEAEYKNTLLVNNLEHKREHFCNIGTRKTKLLLNKLIKKGNLKAEILRILLELEDVNICAKKYFGKYKQTYYDKKSMILNDIVKLFKENNLTIGYHNADDYSCSYIVFVEYEGIQMSWHCNKHFGLNKYEKEWDGLKNSTLAKLERLIEAFLESEQMINSK